MMADCCFWIFALVAAWNLNVIQATRCSWIGSGSASKARRGSDVADDVNSAVRVVNLNCLEGTLNWRHADGAMAVRFRPTPISPGNDQRQFCFRAFTHHYAVSVYHQHQNSLIPLAFDEDTETCVDDNTTLLTLFLDTSAKPPSPQDYRRRRSLQPTNAAPPTAAFYYSVRTQRPKGDDESDCRPCTEQELADAYCDSDVIFEGLRMPPITDERTTRPRLQQLRFIVDNVHRKPVEYSNVFENLRQQSTKAHVYMSGSCVDASTTEDKPSSHLVIAKMSLGRANLRCAPLLLDFTALLARLRRLSICEIRFPAPSS